MTTEKRLEL